ncbi:TMCO4 family protein [Corynebacterium aurimucosum]|nr:TMCO4 family protein [Corynebacterium aurimucosum]
MAKKNSIESAAISFNPKDDGSFSCELRSNLGRFVRVARRGDVQSPEVEGDVELTDSPAIVDALWLAAVGQKESDDLETQLPAAVGAVQEDFNFHNEFISPADQRDFAAKAVKRAVKRQEGEVQELREQAIASAKLATTLAELMDTLSSDTEEGWCSRCLTKSTHRKSKTKSLYVCESCGSATTHCTVPQCDNFAPAGLGLVALPTMCAEHLHQVPDFERLDHRIDDLTQWRELREFKAANVGRAAKLAAAGVATLALGATGGLLAAPMVGGAVGTTFLGFSGAVAQNAGLAALGFGSLASGGLGMAGGSMVVAAAGGLLGSAYGVKALNSYIGEDDSFDIQCVRKGSGTPVLIARGFTTEKKLDWRTEVKAVEAAYPDSPIYLVTWGSKEMLELAGFLAPGAGFAGGAVLKGMVKHASKNLAKKAGPAGFALGALDLVKNPWTVAVNRANKTAMTLAAIIQRSNLESVVLVGHSLGGRVMLNLATALAGAAGTDNEVRVEAVHLLGAAIGQDKGWDSVGEALSGAVHNYHSQNDKVLGYLYPAAMGGRKAIGFEGLDASFAVNHDVTEAVKSHSAYYENVVLSRTLES